MNRSVETKNDPIIGNLKSAKLNDSANKKIADLGQSNRTAGKLRQESMKDSGIGTTYLATSSGSTSENTSPESEKDVQIQNGKAPNVLSSSTIDAASTPATAIKKYKLVDAVDHLGSATICKKIISCGNLTFEEENSIHQLGTPLANRDKTTGKYKDVFASCTTRSNYKKSTEQTEVIAKLVENFNQACQTPGRKRQRRMHACEHCDKQFDRPSLLKRHNLTHTGERPFECRFCSKGFSTRSGVNTHERTHTGQRPYVCRVCGRRFAAGSNLIFHKYTHTNTRRHVCSQCPKAFVTPGDLRKHEYTHTGEWPFRCHLCDRGFATERNLRSHEITHTGQKPYTCPICAKGYAQESSMKTHIRSHQKSNVATLDKLSVSNRKIDSKPVAKETQASNITPLMQHSVTVQSTWQPGEDIHAGTFYLSDANQPMSSIPLYPTHSFGGTLNPQNVVAQHRSAFSIPHSNVAVQSNVMQNQLNTTLNPSELQSLLYDRYRAYYDLYMKALNNPYENQGIMTSFNHNLPTREPVNPTVTSHSTYAHLGNFQPFNNSESKLNYETFDNPISRNNLSYFYSQPQSISTNSSSQQTDSMNLTLRPTILQTQISQPQLPHYTANNDVDLQPLDYSIRGLSNNGKK